MAASVESLRCRRSWTHGAGQLTAVCPSEWSVAGSEAVLPAVRGPHAERRSWSPARRHRVSATVPLSSLEL